jgi:hypothetical protein
VVLLGLDVLRVLSAEGAILVHLKTIGIVLLVLVGIVVSLLALRTSQRDLNTRTCFGHALAPPYLFGFPKKIMRRNIGTLPFAG